MLDEVNSLSRDKLGMTTATRLRISEILIAGIIILFGSWSYLGNLYLNRDSLVDDAYISFHYAQHLASGDGLVWNIGEAPSEGFTNLLLILLLTPFSALGVDLSFVTIVISLISVMVIVGLLWYGCSSFFNLPKEVAALAISVFLCWPPVATHTMSGLETMLFTAVLLGQLTIICRLINKVSSSVLLGFITLGILLALTRPEGFAVVFLCLGFLLVFYSKNQERYKIIVSIIGFVLIFLIWLVARKIYFGYFLPNTFMVKSSTDVLSFPSMRIVFFFFFSLAPLTSLLLLRIIKFDIDKYDLIIVVIISFFIMFYSRIIHIMGFEYRFMFPVFPLLILLAVRALSELSVGNIMQKTRLFYDIHIPFLIPMIIIALFIMLSQILQPDNLISRESSSLQLGKFINIGPLLKDPHNSQVTSWTEVDVNIGRALKRIGVGSQLVCLSEDAGAIAYYSGCSLIDPTGLTDSTIARTRTYQEFLDYLFSRNPDIVIFRQEPPFILDQARIRYQGIPLDKLLQPGGHGTIGRYGKTIIYLDNRFNSYQQLGSISAGDDSQYRWYFFVNNKSRFFQRITEVIRGFIVVSDGESTTER